MRERIRKSFEKWISKPPYEHMCDKHSNESPWSGQYKRYETQLAWEAWEEATKIHDLYISDALIRNQN